MFSMIEAKVLNNQKQGIALIEIARRELPCLKNIDIYL